MHPTSRTSLGILALLTLLTACKAGGDDAPAAGEHAPEFRLRTCSLGCGSGTCLVNHIAVNRSITLVFNDDLDPASIHQGTLSLIERNSGTVPPGQFLVSGRQVTFRPALIETEAGVRFGFREGADYEVVLRAAPASSVARSRLGRPNRTPIRCVLRTEGVIDPVPGPPSVVVRPTMFRPAPLEEQDFEIELTFNDLIQKAGLVDPASGWSPTVHVFVRDERRPFEPEEFEMPGTFVARLDQETLTTTLVFRPAAPYPGNAEIDGVSHRRLRVQVDGLISDLAGNRLTNSGSFYVPLHPRPVHEGDLIEDFASLESLDADGSTAGLWTGSPLGLDSGLDPDAVVAGRPGVGYHRGGGPGILGSFTPDGTVVFDTGSMTFPAEQTLLGHEVTVEGGTFFFEELNVPANAEIRAVGPNPLRIFVRGQARILGRVDLSGQDADTAYRALHGDAHAHSGKYVHSKEVIPLAIEGLPGSSSDEPREPERSRVGAVGATGELTAGGGGRGGDGWFDLERTNGDPLYFDTVKNPAFKLGLLVANPHRYPTIEEGDGPLLVDRVHGFSGEGVGGRASAGRPVDAPDAIHADWASGAGLGSLAWPPTSNGFSPLFDPAEFPEPFDLESHRLPGGGYDRHALHRARGGGGGGYWSRGERGAAFRSATPGAPGDPGPRNPLGEPLAGAFTPVVDPLERIYEFNDRLAFNQRRGAGAAVEDAAGGLFQPFDPEFHTLDPQRGFLLGGAGGGGGGCSQHGSWNEHARDAAADSGECHTFRSSSGCGGGAGGGAAQLQVGGTLDLRGVIALEGGEGGNSAFMLYAPDPLVVWKGAPGTAGGGGGSGGALLLQAAGPLRVQPDRIRLTGGAGGLGDAGNHGGAGGAGILRIETPGAPLESDSVKQLVTPDESGHLGPLGQPLTPNSGPLLVDLAGPLGDYGPFNANSSGVRSQWYDPAPAEDFFLTVVDYEVRLDVFDGSTLSTRTYDSREFPVPGVDPVWIALQSGWGFPDSPGLPASPEPGAKSAWIIPGYTVADGGLDALNAGVRRLYRFQVVFDQDRVKELIGSHPQAFLRVRELRLRWTSF